MTSGTYDVIMRYSSLTPKLVPDNIPAPRGIGMKIFGECARRCRAGDQADTKFRRQRREDLG